MERNAVSPTLHHPNDVSQSDSYPILPHAGNVPNPIAVPPRDLHAEPGTRAPHVGLRWDGVRLSSLDLFGDGLALLAEADAADWCREADASCHQHGIPISWHVVGRDVDDLDAVFPAAYGISASGVALVRADGFVLWKAVRTTTFSEAELLTVLVNAQEVYAPVA